MPIFSGIPSNAISTFSRLQLLIVPSFRILVRAKQTSTLSITWRILPPSQVELGFVLMLKSRREHTHTLLCYFGQECIPTVCRSLTPLTLSSCLHCPSPAAFTLHSPLFLFMSSYPTEHTFRVEFANRRSTNKAPTTNVLVGRNKGTDGSAHTPFFALLTFGKNLVSPS